MEYEKKLKTRVVNEFSSKENVAEVLDLVRGERVAGELVVNVAPNGGVSSIVFREREKTHAVENENDSHVISS